jgi:hypothetical protein
MDKNEDIDMFIDAVVRRALKRKAQILQNIRDQVEQYSGFNNNGKFRCAIKLICFLVEPKKLYYEDYSNMSVDRLKVYK